VTIRPSHDSGEPGLQRCLNEWIERRGLPNGTTELLLDTAICALAEDGAEYVTQGLSPLSRAVPQRPEPPWAIRPLLAWMRVHTRRFYNFEGLEVRWAVGRGNYPNTKGARPRN
jgi:hypothetical protein